MSASFVDSTTNPIVIPSGKPFTPFTKIAVNETTLGATENISVVLSTGSSYPYGISADLGSLSDPLGGGSYNATTHTFTETAIATGTPTSATAILQRLVYTPPTLTTGSYEAVNTTITDNDSPYFPYYGNTYGNTVTDPTRPVLETVTPPSITGTIANEPVASGATLRPFASVRVADYNLGYNARDAGTITLTDAAGNPTDADGLLTGPGLGKTGIGTYALVAGSYYDIQNNLQALVFTPAAVAAGSTRTTTFGLHVSDIATTLATDDNTTSVLVIGPTVMLVPPLIAGTAADQTVAPGNAISPFNGVTISDTNVNPQDSATLTVSGGGTLSGAGLVAGSAGVYTIAATSPAALTAILDKITFTAPPLGGQPSVTSTIKLDVVDRTQTASDSKTTIKEVADPLPPLPVGSNNFAVADQTTGQLSLLSGDKYSGPVAGLSQQLILVTPDNLNISATVPNVFIHSGSGTDAIDVSRVNGNNVLDGSTGSNFLVGGIGRDTFFLDDRNAASDVYSTVVNFHSGDNATIFGVDPVNFHVVTQDNLGAVGAKGLTYTFSAVGKPNASIVIAGFSTADLANGRLTASYGTNADLPNQPGSGGVYTPST